MSDSSPSSSPHASSTSGDSLPPFLTLTETETDEPQTPTTSYKSRKRKAYRQRKAVEKKSESAYQIFIVTVLNLRGVGFGFQLIGKQKTVHKKGDYPEDIKEGDEVIQLDRFSSLISTEDANRLMTAQLPGTGFIFFVRRKIPEEEQEMEFHLENDKNLLSVSKILEDLENNPSLCEVMHGKVRDRSKESLMSMVYDRNRKLSTAQTHLHIMAVENLKKTHMLNEVRRKYNVLLENLKALDPNNNVLRYKFHPKCL